MAQRISPNLLRLLAQFPGLDPAAVLAVASTEGGLYNREGDIGDLGGGGSFGPFQLYSQGALPAQYRGNHALADQWAWSPQGIKYALSKIAGVARGLKGQDAIRAIVSQFERPAEPGAEIAKASSRYGQFQNVRPGAAAPPGRVPAGAAGITQRAPAQNSPDIGLKLFQALSNGGDPARLASIVSGGVRSAPPRSPELRGPTPKSPSLPIPGRVPGKARGGLAEAFYDPIGAYDEGNFISPIGGHSDHVHLSFKTPAAALAAIRYAQKIGLSARENPYVDPVDPVHTKGSYHYRTFPGMYGGRRLGEAGDFSGASNLMAQLYRWSLQNLR